MRRLATGSIVFALLFVALSGCSGKKSSDGGEPSPADAAGTEYDRAIGNDGYHITGSFGGTATALDAGSAASLDIHDEVENDAGSGDRADLTLNVAETGLKVVASLRSMATGESAGSSADFYGGTERNVPIFGTTGIGPSELPETQAYLFAAGFANVKIGDAPSTTHFVIAAVTKGLRDSSHSALTAADDANLQLHVVFPGTASEADAFTSQPEGFLYYYFEKVSLQVLDQAQRDGIGKGLKGPATKNEPPIASGTVTVGGKDATSATMEGNKSVSVVFDGSASTDADGTVTRWIWRVFELTPNGTYEKPPAEVGPAVVLDKMAPYNFTTPGRKIINLTVTDDLAAASQTFILHFYVDQHSKVGAGQMEGSFHTQAPAAFASCNPPVNCFDRTSSIGPGLTSATYKVTENESMLTGVHIEIYAPGSTTALKSVTANQLEVAAKDLPKDPQGNTVLGRYTIRIWWQAHTSTGGADGDPQTNDNIFDFEATLKYTEAV